jgi:hypothetical protein
MIRTILLASVAFLGALPAAAQPIYFSLDFPGGTLTQYVEAIRKANPEADIITDDMLSLFPVSPTRLTNVDLNASLNLLSGSRIATPQGLFELEVNYAPIGQTGDVIVRLQVELLGRDNTTLETSVWSLRGLIELGMPTKDALSAIETAISLVPHEAIMKYHEQTNLLIVSGNEQAIRLVDSTIETLSNSAEHMSRLDQNNREHFTQLEFELAEAQANLQLAAETMRVRQIELDNAIKIAGDQSGQEAGDVENTFGVLPYKLAVAQAQRDLFVVQKRTEMLQKQLDQLRADQ